MDLTLVLYTMDYFIYTNYQPMHIPTKYFHDRLVLLILTVNTFLTGLLTVLTLLRLDSTKAESYIVQYRANLGVNAFRSGDGSTFIVFIAFAWMILVFHTILSMRVYEERKQFSTVILVIATLLLVLSLFVSNALLTQR